MLGSIGFPEILFILALALLVFGPKRLPDVGRTLGKGLREFRKASNELRRSVEDEMHLDEPPSPVAVPGSVAAPTASPAGTTPRGSASEGESGETTAEEGPSVDRGTPADRASDGSGLEAKPAEDSEVDATATRPADEGGPPSDR